METKLIKKNYKAKILVIALALITLFGTSFGYIYYMYLKRDTRDNNLTTALVDIQFNESSVINLQNEVPKTDAEGKLNTPYTFSIKSLSTAPIDANIYLDVKSNTTIDLGAVRFILYEGSEEVDSGDLSKLNSEGLLTTYKNIQKNETHDLKLVLWIDYYYTKSAKVFNAVIRVEGQSYDYIKEPAIKLLDDNGNGTADIGEMIQIGTEKFYVYNNDGTNIKALAEYNLLFGNSCTSTSSSSCTPLSNPTGLQDSSAIGWHYAEGTTTDEYPSIGTTAFSSDSKKGTNYSDYEGSIVEGYVNEYKTKLEDMGANIKNATLITKEEIETLINDGNSLSEVTYINTKADSLNMQWLYKTSYWTRSASSGNFLWHVVSDSHLSTGIYSYDSYRGVRPVIEVSISDVKIQKPKVTKLLDDNGNGIADIGEMIQIGTEKFYIYNNDGTNIKALAEYNLLVGNSYDGSTTTPLSNPTGLQDSSALAYHYAAAGTKTVEYPTIGTTAFSSDSQKGTNYSDYEGSIVEGYVNEYKTKLEDMGANIRNATLITKEEIETLINDGNSLSSGYINTKADPLNMQWLYKTTYWTRSPASNSLVWFVYSYGYLSTSSYSSNYYYRGVRPVIEILVSDI